MEKIIAYCERIEEHLARYQMDYTSFTDDPMFQDACCMCVVQIGELVAKLSDEVKAQNHAIPWRAIKDTRNIYVHSYGSIDLPAVWGTLTMDIPELKHNCAEILARNV